MSPPTKASTVRQFFSRHGALSQWHPNYEYRPGQVEIAEAVESALTDSKHLIVEAGTGAVLKPYLKICLAVLVIAPAIGLPAQIRTWPAIRPMEEKRVFVDPGRDNADTPFVALVEDTGGVPVYKLECHNGNYQDESELNFSGDFQCALFAVKRNTLTSGNLLAANTKNELSTDWWNRGRMRSVQLRGKCLEYPEYSTVRHFKLRGMLVTLRFTDLQWSNGMDRQENPLIGGFTFTASAVPDATAQSSRAEPVRGPQPPTSCYP